MGVRGISLTYGQSYFNGRFLNTGRVQSADAQTYFDLDSSEIAGNIKFIPAGGGYKSIAAVDATATDAEILAFAAQVAANEAKGVTDNFTVISGGLISSNTIKLGTLAQDVAGITGVGTSANSVRFWAGQSYSNRGIAPFRVDQSGNLVATNATISGHITATSGSIGGINISANDLFTLSGTLVQISPNAGMASQGYANFTGSLKIPVTAPSSPAAGHIWAVDAVAAGSAPVNFSTLAALTDIAIGSQTNGQALIWDSSLGKWKPGSVSSGGGGDYWTKSESDGRYYGSFNPQVNISGNAGSATLWGGKEFVYSTTGVINSYMLTYGIDGKVHVEDVNTIRAYLGLGSAAYASTGAFYNAGSTVANSNAWGGQQYSGSVSSHMQYAMIYNPNTARFELGNAGLLQAFMGMPNGGDTLASVTARGASTTGSITVNGSITTSDVYNNAWFRNTTAGVGLFNSALGGHFYQLDADFWALNGASSGPGGLAVVSGYGGTIRGYLYGDGTNFGLLYGGGWAVKATSTGGELIGSWTTTGTIYGAGTISAAGYFYSNNGLYGPSYGSYFIPIDSGWRVQGNNGVPSIAMYSTDGVLRGYFSANNTGVVGGVRNTAGSWMFYSNSAGALWVASSITAGGDIIAYYTSDRFLKDNIRRIDNPLTKLRQLSGNYFEWNGQQDTYEVGKTDLGVIAQEVEAVFPELVTTRDNGFKAVKYEKLIPVLIESIKELSQRVEMAERRITHA